jgi:sulfofructose kinase
MSKRVLGVGLAGFDHIAEVDEIPGPDEHAFMRGYDRQAGGIVGNALTAMARLGIETAWAGKVGGDEYGRFILDEMLKDGVDTSRVIIDPEGRTPFSLVLVDHKTRGRSIVFNRGCSGSYGAPIEESFIARFDALHLDGYVPDAAFDASEKAKKLGVKVSLDAGLMFPGLHELLKRSDIFVPTRAIAAELTGETDMAAAMRKLAGAGPEIVAVTMGAEGSMGLWRGEIVKIPGFEIDAADTTAAGDTYHGAFIYAYLQGWPIEKILTFSNAVSALKCTRPGGRRGIPMLAEVSAFLKNRGIVL